MQLFTRDRDPVRDYRRENDADCNHRNIGHEPGLASIPSWSDVDVCPMSARLEKTPQRATSSCANDQFRRTKPAVGLRWRIFWWRVFFHSAADHFDGHHHGYFGSGSKYYELRTDGEVRTAQRPSPQSSSVPGNYSVFTSSTYRTYTAGWRFPQEIATLHDLAMPTSEVKMPEDLGYRIYPLVRASTAEKRSSMCCA